jgi:hypothetical protein
MADIKVWFPLPDATDPTRKVYLLLHDQGDGTFAPVISSSGLSGSGVGATHGTPALILSTANSQGSSGHFIDTDATILAFDATNPAAIGTVATGSASTAARRDHVHATGAGTPSTQAFGDAAAVGSGPAAAMTDHKHAMPSFATNAITLDSAAAAGNATTPFRSNDVIAAFDTVAPSTQAVGDSAVVGTAAFAARRDHKHARESFATNAILLGSAAAAGGAATPMRSNDTIAAFDATNPSTQAFGDAAAVGTAAFAARRDHKHAMMAASAAAPTAIETKLSSDVTMTTAGSLYTHTSLTTTPPAGTYMFFGTVEAVSNTTLLSQFNIFLCSGGTIVSNVLTGHTALIAGTVYNAASNSGAEVSLTKFVKVTVDGSTPLTVACTSSRGAETLKTTSIASGAPTNKASSLALIQVT